MPDAGRGTIPPPGSLALPPAGQVRVWWSRIATGRLTDPERAALAADLDVATAARAGRFVRAEDRDRALAAHAIFRRVLAAVVGGPPSRVRLLTVCATCGSTAHGKPMLDPSGGGPEVHANLSHSGEIVAVALAGDRAVGIDVEAPRRVEWASLRRNVFGDVEWEATAAGTDPDRARLAAWTRKEAAVKATGHGLARSLRHVVPVLEGPHLWHATLPEREGAVLGHDLRLVDGYVGAVAVVTGTGIGTGTGGGLGTGTGIGLDLRVQQVDLRGGPPA